MVGITVQDHEARLGRECVHPERRIGSGHGTYDDIILLNEMPDYEAAWDRGFNEGLKGCVTNQGSLAGSR